MTLELFIGYYDPYSGAWMCGFREFWVDNEAEALEIEQRYDNFYKETYGNGAEAFRVELRRDQ